MQKGREVFGPEHLVKDFFDGLLHEFFDDLAFFAFLNRLMSDEISGDWFCNAEGADEIEHLDCATWRWKPPCKYPKIA